MAFASSIFAALPLPGPGGIIPGGPEAPGGLYQGSHRIALVEDRANEISVPFVKVANIFTRFMAWDDINDEFIDSEPVVTRISEYIKQLNKRYLGSAALNPLVVTRCDTIDAESGNRFVFTPGATPPGSLQDFEVIIPDQSGGDFESRGFTITLATDANPNPVIDTGEVWLRLTPQAFPF